MLAIERKNEILNKLRNEQRVLVSELAALYNVTEETIRRDLDKLEREGYATKTYGGAILGGSQTDLPSPAHSKIHADAKNAIAALVAGLIQDGDHLMLDDSSTALYIAKQLKTKKNLTVITYSVEIVAELSGIKGWTVLCTGGRLKSGTLALIGHQVAQALSKYHVEKAIFSCKGIDQHAGITDSAESHAIAKQAMMRAGKQSILALDSSKFDKISFVEVSPLSGVQAVVTDRKPNPAWLQYFDSIHMPCYYPK